MIHRVSRRELAALCGGAVATAATGIAAAQSANPIRIGLGMALTGPLAPNGKSALLAMQIWEETVNAKDGLLGRPVKLVYYDDQSNPSNVPGIYTKLINVDKVDLILGPYATNMVAAAMPVIMENSRSAMPPDKFWRRPSRRPAASIKMRSPITCTATVFRPWPVKSLSARTANGRSRARSSPNFRMSRRTTLSNSRPAANSRSCGRRNSRPAR